MKIIVLNAGKCSWGKCVFCGWGKGETLSFAQRHGETETTPSEAETAKSLIEKFDRERRDEDVKLFCSGSLLDTKQFPKAFQEHVAKAMQCKTLYIESRPEYVTKKSLDIFKGVKLVVAMGLEAADNETLKKLIKGITIKEFKEKAKLIHEQGFKTKSYILVNPPFDYPGLLDKTVKFALENTDELVLINTYPHARSELFDLWIKGEWKPLSEKEFYKLTKKYEASNVSLDANNYAFTPKFPDEKKANLAGVGLEYITHPHFQVWQDYISRLYERPADKDIALFLPCSKKKPYYTSRTHIAIRRAIAGHPWYKRVHFIVISNPGVIPIEFADKYPFTDYDWNETLETPELMKEYIRINTERIKNYLKNHEYKIILSYFKPTSESGIALENACKELGIKLVKLCDEETLKKIHYEKNPLIHPLMIRAFREKIGKELKNI